VNYKRAFIIVVAFLFSGPVLFTSQGKPAIFNEVEPMYPKAVIKASFPKTYVTTESK
jgi:hypothetical protein